MPLMDNIARLRAIATSERVPVETIRGIQGDVLLVLGEVKEILGEGHVYYGGISDLAGVLSQKLDEAIAAAEAWGNSIEDTADLLEMGGSR
jgi:Na+-translocating ferredoxin:NAD+ oxidoreductase RnfE subunit